MVSNLKIPQFLPLYILRERQLVTRYDLLNLSHSDHSDRGITDFGPPEGNSRVPLFHVLLHAHVVDILNVALAAFEHWGEQLGQVRGLAAVSAAVILVTPRQSPLYRVFVETLTRAAEEFCRVPLIKLQFFRGENYFTIRGLMLKATVKRHI